jgi:hypothetical protein
MILFITTAVETSNPTRFPQFCIELQNVFFEVNNFYQRCYESGLPTVQQVPLLHAVNPLRQPCIIVLIGYGLDNRGFGVRALVGSRILSFSCHPDRFWGPPSLLSNWYGGSLPRGKVAEV